VALPTEFFLGFSALLGLLIGSFLNVLIHRIPRNENIAFPASHCTSCNKPLRWYHNIPLFSWLFLGGKCSFCKSAISSRYIIVELLNSLLYVALAWKLSQVWYLPFIWMSFSALLALVFIDIEYMAVPDSINIPAFLFALITPTFVDSLIDGLMAAAGLFLVGKISSILAKKEAMGSADVIVAATMGALLGYPGFFIAIFLSAVLALIPSLIYRDKGVPFIPFLATATLIVYLFDTEANHILNSIIYG